MFNLIEFESHGDDRGSLISIEEIKSIPFNIKRVYFLFDTKREVVRGLHAHKNLSQVLICLSGSFKLTLDNGKKRDSKVLKSPNIGVLIESYIWREMTDFSEDCVILVIANENYDENDYIRNYDDFLSHSCSK